MLKTPLGEIIVRIDGVSVGYEPVLVKTDHTCQNVDGRFYICITRKNNLKAHKISCEIDGYIPNENDCIESGEHLELKSFYREYTKLSIGAEYDIDGSYDYECEYLPNGLQYNILPKTQTRNYIFGIAWINQCNEQTDIQTWFGADPTLIYTPRSKEYIERYIEVNKVCTEYIFREPKAFLNVLYGNGARVKAILWYDYCMISDREKLFGRGGYRDMQNPDYMWAETKLYDDDLEVLSLNEMLQYIDGIKKQYPEFDLYPSFFIE